MGCIQGFRNRENELESQLYFTIKMETMNLRMGRAFGNMPLSLSTRQIITSKGVC